MNKPLDTKATEIQFGIEIETNIPVNCGITVGRYHHGNPVTSGIEKASGRRLNAPQFNGRTWRADSDSSIQVEPGYGLCEFVSPRLQGDEGLMRVREFLAFANAIGAKVNASCGCHITVGLKSLLGSADNATVAAFVRRLARFAKSHAWAIYAQTGTNRHLNHYTLNLADGVAGITDEMLETHDLAKLVELAGRCGRGIVNFQKAFLPNPEDRAIEVRAFAGTLNEAKVFHHLATVFGLMRKVAATKATPKFQRSKRIKLATAHDALKRMYRVFGWVDGTSTTDVALGLFGLLYTEFKSYRKAGERMVDKFESAYPRANI